MQDCRNQIIFIANNKIAKKHTSKCLITSLNLSNPLVLKAILCVKLLKRNRLKQTAFVVKSDAGSLVLFMEKMHSKSIVRSFSSKQILETQNSKR